MGLHFINTALLFKKEATNSVIVVKYLKTASGPESTFFVRVLINGSDLLTPSVRPCNKSDSTCTIKGKQTIQTWLIKSPCANVSTEEKQFALSIPHRRQFLRVLVVSCTDSIFPVVLVCMLAIHVADCYRVKVSLL